eukprot:jgi/Undpi1/10401/HiC_scaffold_29.g12851.m1
MSRPGQRQGQQTAIVVGNADRFGALVVSTGKEFIKKHPVISVSWVVGLLVSTLASGYTPTPAAVQNYEFKMASLNDEGLAEAQGEMVYWDNVYRRSKGMFWTCDEQCQHNKREFQKRQKAFNIINREYLNGVAQAKSELGLFSEDGVEETRDLFWRKVSGGKQFAKRATMWDALFVGVGTLRRDEGIAAVIAKIVFRFVVNLTMGLFMAVVGFLFSIWQIIWSYNPDPLSTMAFFAMASLGAVSLLATWLLGMAAVGVTGVYAVAKMAETAQIEAAGGGGGAPASRGQYVQQQQQQQQWRSQHQQQQQQPRQRRPAAQGTSSPGWDNID